MATWEDITFFVVIVKSEGGPELVLSRSFTQFELSVERAVELYGHSLKELGVSVVRVAKIKLREVREDGD
jgi:hypothetical protein